jgi:hypothetical protein
LKYNKGQVKKNFIAMHHKLPEKQEQVKFQISRWKEIIKIKEEINKRPKPTIQKINKTNN